MHNTTSSRTVALSSDNEEKVVSTPPPPTTGTPELADGASPTKPAANPFAGKGRDFWLTFGALLASCFLSALDLTGVSTVLPTSQSAFSLLQLHNSDP